MRNTIGVMVRVFMQQTLKNLSRAHLVAFIKGSSPTPQLVSAIWLYLDLGNYKENAHRGANKNRVPTEHSVSLLISLYIS